MSALSRSFYYDAYLIVYLYLMSSLSSVKLPKAVHCCFFWRSEFQLSGALLGPEIPSLILA